MQVKGGAGVRTGIAWQPWPVHAPIYRIVILETTKLDLLSDNLSHIEENYVLSRIIKTTHVEYCHSMTYRLSCM